MEVKVVSVGSIYTNQLQDSADLDKLARFVCQSMTIFRFTLPEIVVEVDGITPWIDKLAVFHFRDHFRE